MIGLVAHPAPSAPGLVITFIRRIVRAVKARQWAIFRLPLIRHLRMLALRRPGALYPGRAEGTQVVRHYWAQFLAAHRGDVRGRALEIGVTNTIRQLGGDRITSAEAIDITASGPDVTIVADLATAADVPGEQFDAFVHQFTIHIIPDFRAALYHSIRLLKPGGTLLINFPCRTGYPASGIPLGEGRTGWVHWWFTPKQVETALADLGISPADCEITTYGNYLALTSYMAGIPAEALTTKELDAVDPDFPLLICARIRKPAQWAPRYTPG